MTGAIVDAPFTDNRAKLHPIPVAGTDSPRTWRLHQQANERQNAGKRYTESADQIVPIAIGGEPILHLPDRFPLSRIESYSRKFRRPTSPGQDIETKPTQQKHDHRQRIR